MKKEKKKHDWKWIINKIQNIAKQGRLKGFFIVEISKCDQ
jgi:hypothetical protein